MRNRTGLIMVVALLAVPTLVAAIYHEVLSFGFLRWDDGTYVSSNPHINRFDWEFVKWSLSTTYFSYWHPLTWLSHGFDYAIWGLDARFHHLINLLAYMFVCWSVYGLTVTVLRSAPTSNASESNLSDHVAGFVAAILFTVHPQHVEVVAWVSERKELLSTLFIVLTVTAYLNYGRRGHRAWLFVSFLLFLLALMSKPMAVTIPVLLLIFDWYPLNRMDRSNALSLVFKEKAVFFVASGCVALMTILSQDATGAIQNLPIDVRILNAFNNVSFYVFHWLWPFGLSAYYPFPDYVVEFDIRALVPIAIFVAISALAIERYRAGYRYWLCTWLVYLVSVAPVIGLLHSGPQAAADRYAHLSTLPFYCLAAVGIARLWTSGGNGSRAGIPLGLALITVVFGVTSHRQAEIWRDDLTLWRSVAARYPERSSLVHTNLGNAWHEAGRSDLAESEYRRALNSPGGHRISYRNLYRVLVSDRGADNAQSVFEALAAERPSSGMPRQILGEISLLNGDSAAAEQHFRAALDVEPWLASPHLFLAQIRVGENDYAAAVDALNLAIEAAPDYVDALLLLARLLHAFGESDGALAIYSRAFAISPEYPPAYRSFIDALRDNGRDEDAETIYRRVARLRDFSDW